MYLFQVLKAGENVVTPPANAEKQPEMNGGPSPEKKEVQSPPEPPSKRKRIQDKIRFEDLQGDDTAGKELPQLALSRVRIQLASLISLRLYRLLYEGGQKCFYFNKF